MLLPAYRLSPIFQLDGGTSPRGKAKKNPQNAFASLPSKEEILGAPNKTEESRRPSRNKRRSLDEGVRSDGEKSIRMEICTSGPHSVNFILTSATF